MRTRVFILVVWLLLLTSIVEACAPPQPLPEGPTPIPTLIPTTLSPASLEPTEVAPRVVEEYPAGLPSAGAGRDLYTEHCAECHGDDGNSVVPNARNFSDVDYMRGKTPTSFYLAITEGLGPDMPAFGELLSSDERWDVTYYVWRFSTTDEKIVGGQEIYNADCDACHGEDGRSMILGAANFSNLRFIANRSPSDLYVVVTQGKGSMPAFQARLVQDKRWDVIDYLTTFSYDPNVGSEVVVSTPEPEPTEAGRPECAAYQAQSNPFDWDDASASTAGEALYGGCAGCHGEDGTGGLPGIIDFSDPVIQADLRDDPGKYLCGVAEGLNAMPPFKSSYNEEEIWQVLTYIGTFGD